MTPAELRQRAAELEAEVRGDTLGPEGERGAAALPAALAKWDPVLLRRAMLGETMELSARLKDARDALSSVAIDQPRLQELVDADRRRRARMRRLIVASAAARLVALSAIVLLAGHDNNRASAVAAPRHYPPPMGNTRDLAVFLAKTRVGSGTLFAKRTAWR